MTCTIRVAVSMDELIYLRLAGLLQLLLRLGELLAGLRQLALRIRQLLLCLRSPRLQVQRHLQRNRLFVVLCTEFSLL
jgi:hypothetical protein